MCFRDFQSAARDELSEFAVFRLPRKKEFVRLVEQRSTAHRLLHHRDEFHSFQFFSTEFLLLRSRKRVGLTARHRRANPRFALQCASMLHGLLPLALKSTSIPQFSTIFPLDFDLDSLFLLLVAPRLELIARLFT